MSEIMTPGNPDIPPGHVLPIVKDRVFLSEPCTSFDFTDAQTNPIQLASDLVATMLKNNGVGLAANQVGYKLRVFAMRTAPEMTVVFNPKIVSFSDDEEVLEEGCLSFPNLIIPIKRPKSIRVRFAYPNGEIGTHTYAGLTARVFQHELDHIDGVLFFSRANKIHLERALKKKARLDKQLKERTSKLTGNAVQDSVSSIPGSWLSDMIKQRAAAEISPK